MKHDEVSERWMTAISQRVAGYKGGGGGSPASAVSTDINKRLVAAMIERMRPGGDSASLVYSAQKLVEMRFETMKIESVQAATKLFEDVAMQLYHEVEARGGAGQTQAGGRWRWRRRAPHSTAGGLPR